MITVKNLCLDIDGREILKDVSAVFPRGEITTIIGKNGCGKTTMLRAVAGLNKIKSGRIYYNDEDLTALSVKKHARIVAFLPQSREIPAVSVRSLVSHGRFPHLDFPRVLTDKDREIIESSMELFGVKEYAERSLNTLSGGQRQKVYLAMAVCQDTPVVLLDEPATYLDIAQQLEVTDIARKIAKMGKTVIMVHHDIPQAVRYSDSIVLMDKGKAVFQGSGEELCASKLIERVFSVKTYMTHGRLIIE